MTKLPATCGLAKACRTQPRTTYALTGGKCSQTWCFNASRSSTQTESGCSDIDDSWINSAPYTSKNNRGAMSCSKRRPALGVHFHALLHDQALQLRRELRLTPAPMCRK